MPGLFPCFAEVTRRSGCQRQRLNELVAFLQHALHGFSPRARFTGGPDPVLHAPIPFDELSGDCRARIGEDGGRI